MKYIKKENYRNIQELLNYSQAQKNEMIKKYGTTDLLDLLNEKDKLQLESLEKSIHQFEKLLDLPNSK